MPKWQGVVGTWLPVGMAASRMVMLRQRAGKRRQAHQCGQDADVTVAELQPGGGSARPGTTASLYITVFIATSVLSRVVPGLGFCNPHCQVEAYTREQERANSKAASV